jgi:hypothetical protein
MKGSLVKLDKGEEWLVSFLLATPGWKSKVKHFVKVEEKGDG